MKIHIHKEQVNIFSHILDEYKIEYKKYIGKNIDIINKVLDNDNIPKNIKLPEYTIDWNFAYNHYVFECDITKERLNEICRVNNLDCNGTKLYYNVGSYIELRKSIKNNQTIENYYLNDENIKPPIYPIYVISYQREHLLQKKYTMSILDSMKIPYYICIKECELDNYKKMLENLKYKYYTLIAMDKEFEYNQNSIGNYGGIPQRNYCWEHSIGFSKYWILDDNIKGFYLWNKFAKTEFNNPLFFSLLENFMDSIIEDVGLLSPNYYSEYPDYDLRDRYYINQKNYSCILVNTKLLEKKNIRWRKTYNEDVRLGLDCLINNIRTIGFNQFLIWKESTGSLKGGNSEIYENHKLEGYEKKFREIQQEYPDYIKNTKKYKDGRSHHSINYNKFKEFKFITFK